MTRRRVWALALAAIGLIGSPSAQAAQCTGGTPTACGGATAVTYNGVALTKLGVASNGTVQAEIWYLKAPPSGTNNIVVTAPYGTDVMASAVSFTGVNQTTTFGTIQTAFGTSNTASRTITSGTVGDPIFDIMGAYNTSTAPTVTAAATAGQTLRNTNNTSTGINRLVSGNSTAYGKTTSTNMSWTLGSSVDWAHAAVAIRASTTLTGVDTGSFVATWADDGTRLEWNSAYQPTSVGFYVHRREGNNPRTRLNADLIQGGTLQGGMSSFAWTDSTPGWNGPVSYWLEEVYQNGSTKWYGPASPVPPPAEPTTPGPTARPDGGAPDAQAPSGGGFTGAGGTRGGGAQPGFELQSGCTIGSRGHNLDAARMLVLLGVGLSARRRKGRRGWVLPLLLVALLCATTFVGQPQVEAAGGVAVDATSTGTGMSGLTISHTMSSASNGLLVVGVVVPITCVTTVTNSQNCGSCTATCGLEPSLTSVDTSGLIGMWHFNEGSGSTSADSSGTGSTATLIGSPSWVMGYGGNGLQFNGTSSYAQAPLTTHFGNNNALSASVWVYATTNTNGPVFGVSSLPAGGASWNMPFLSVAGNTVYGQIWNNTIISGTLTLNAWNLVTLTYNAAGSGNTTFLYVNNALASQTTGAFSSAGQLVYWTTYIPGSKPGAVTNSYLLGRIDEVRAYNRAITLAEHQSLYAARKACATSACAACGSGKTNCSGTCVTTASDNFNCGGCGTTCNTAGGQTCTTGSCVCSTMGYTSCSTVCVNTVTDPSNCGSCGNVCGNDTPTFVDSGLVGRWKMNEGSGTTTADASGNGRTATLTGSPTWTSNGYSGYGLTFNGATNYLNAPLGTAFGTNQTLSATAWVYATSTTNGPIFGVTDTAPGGGWNMPFLSIAGATAYGHIWNVNSNTPLSTTVSLNAWHHLAITYDPSLGTNNEKFYVDGALVAQGTGTFSNSGSTSYLTTYIPGAKPSGVNSYLTGLIDELRGYSRVLSANEISIIYNSRRTCASSACSTCGGGLTACSGTCTNTTIDPNNCGTCGNVCTTSAGQSCTSGVCVCSSGTACGTQCVDTATNSSHCGACNNACTAVTCPSCSHGIVGYWPLSEGSGSTSADASTVPANGLTATLTGSPTWTTGYSGNAVSFDGATQYLNAPLAAWLGNNNKLSVSAWVYATSTTNGPIFGVTNTAPGGGWNMPFLSINGATVYGWIWQVNGNTPLSTTVTLNAWHHLVITYDPTLGSANEKFYVDGVLSSSGTGTYSPAGGNVYWTTYVPGAKPSGVNSYLNGKVDEVRAFKRVLTDGEVKLLYDTKRTCSGSACSGCPTGTTTCGTSCTNTSYDPANCGGCAGSGGSVCSGATPYCVNGACSATH